MKITEPAAAQRVALYIRVSTEEQVMRGYSLEAQREALESYAKAHGMMIVDFYQDEGRSARKSYRTRPECMRLLRDVEAGRVDLILFIKLDRWFRSVGDYYEVHLPNFKLDVRNPLGAVTLADLDQLQAAHGGVIEGQGLNLAGLDLHVLGRAV